MNIKNQINWGVIGSGGIAKRRTIPEGITKGLHSKLVSVYDIDSKINTKVANEYNVTSAKSIEDLLDSKVDAIYVASPVNKHLEHVIACAKAKKHVLCEKPLGLTVEEVEKMISICDEEGVLLGTGLLMRFLAQHQSALKLIQDGKLGIPVYARAQLSCWYPPIKGAWRQDPKTGGGGSLVDMGSHCIDLLEMYFGNVKSVSCFINNSVHAYESEDSAIVALRFKSGAMATVDTFFCIPDNSSKNMLELYGSKGSILATGTIGQGESGKMIAYMEGNSTKYNAQQARALEEGMEINPKPVNTYMAEIEEFSNAILEKRVPVNNAMIGLRSQKTLDACYKSAQTGEVVLVE